MLLLDWPQSHYKFLLGGGTAPTWPPTTVFPRAAEETFHAVNYDQLVAVAREWVESEEGPQTEAYHTTLETAAPRPPSAASDDLLAQILAQMQDTAGLVNRLQADLDNLKAQPSPSPPSGSAEPSALGAARQLVGVAPKTRALTALKGIRQDTDAGALSEENVEEDAEELPLDQLLKAALVGMLDKKKQKTKARSTGLPFTADHSDFEGEEDPLRRLSGAKGTMLLEKLRFAMESEPQAYISAIESLAAQTLGEASAHGEVHQGTAPNWCRANIGIHGVGHWSGIDASPWWGDHQGTFGALASHCGHRAVQVGWHLELSLADYTSDPASVLGMANSRGAALGPTSVGPSAYAAGTCHLASRNRGQAEGRGGVNEEALPEPGRPSQQARQATSWTRQRQRRTRCAKHAVNVTAWSDLPHVLYSLLRRSRTKSGSFFAQQL